MVCVFLCVCVSMCVSHPSICPTFAEFGIYVESVEANLAASFNLLQFVLMGQMNEFEE